MQHFAVPRLCLHLLTCAARLPFPARETRTRGRGSPETGNGRLYFPPGVIDGPSLPDLVAAVPAFGAAVFPPVDRAEVVQGERQVRAFAHGDNMVDLPAVDTTRDGMVTQPADRPVRGVHEAAQLLPPVPAPAHPVTRRFHCHTYRIGGKL